VVDHAAVINHDFFII